MKKGFIVAVFSLVILVGTVYATITTPTHRRFETVIGGTMVVTGGITAIDRGFDVANLDIAARGTSSGSPGLFSSGVSANTAITAGDWVLSFVLGTTVSTPPSTTFVVTLNLVEAPEGQTFATLYVATDAGGAAQSIIVAYSAGPSLGTPLSYTVTVEKL